MIFTIVPMPTIPDIYMPVCIDPFESAIYLPRRRKKLKGCQKAKKNRQNIWYSQKKLIYLQHKEYL